MGITYRAIQKQIETVNQVVGTVAAASKLLAGQDGLAAQQLVSSVTPLLSKLVRDGTALMAKHGRRKRNRRPR